MPKRGKEPRPSSRHSGGHFSPTPPSRQSRNDYQIAGPSRSTSDSSSGRRSPHSKDSIKNSNGNTRLGNSSNRMLNMNIVDSPIILTDDDDDDDYQNLDSSKNIFRENGNKLKPDPGDCTRIVKHFVPSADRYQMSQCAPEKPVFRGPETDVLLELEQDKLKNIKIQMLRADVQNESFRKAYVVQEPIPNRSKGNESDQDNNRNHNISAWTIAEKNKEKNHQHFDDRSTHFNSTQPIHYDNGDKNYGMIHPISPSRIIINRDRSLSPRMNMGRPPSPPPYSPERDHFSSDGGLRRDRQKRSPDRNMHDRPPKPEHYMEHVKMENFNLSHPPEPRSPEMHRYRSTDHHNRHRMKDELSHYDDRTKRSRSPVYYGNHYQYRSVSPNNRPFSPSRAHLPMSMSPPTSRELSPSSRDRPPHSSERSSHSNERSRRRRSPHRRDRSRERRRRVSPRRRTPPPSNRSPVKRRENGKKRGSNKNQESRKRELKERKRRSQSKSKSSAQPEQQQSSFQQPPQQALYPPPPPPGVVRLPPPPRPYPPGPMLIPLRPPPFPPPMGAWRPARPPPMQAPPPSGWPYPRPRPFYFPY